MTIEAITTTKEFNRLKPLWNSMLPGTEPNFFLTWEWVSCWWKHFGQHRQLRILTQSKHGELVAIAPLMSTRYRLLSVYPLTRVEFIGVPDADYHGLLANSSDEIRFGPFIDYLNATFDDWDQVELEHIPDTPFYHDLLFNHSDLGPVEMRQNDVSQFLKLPSRYAHLEQRVKGALRRSLRRTLRRLRENHRVDFVNHTHFSSIPHAMSTMIQLHQRRMATKGLSGLFANQQRVAFHQELAECCIRQGWLELLFLLADDEPIAVNYNFKYHNKVFGYQSGFEPNYAVYGPGQLLIKYALQCAVTEGMQEYDFLRGYEEYKNAWNPQILHHHTLSHLRKNFVGKAYFWATKSEGMKWLGKRFGLHDILASAP